MKNIAAISLGAVALIFLPVISYYIDGSCVRKQIENISDTLVNCVIPVGEWSVTLWCFIVDCMFVPFIWTINNLLSLTEVIQNLIVYAVELFPSFTNIVFMTPMTPVRNVISSASNFISTVLTRVVHADTVSGGIMVPFRDDLQCVVDDQKCGVGQNLEEFITALSNPDSFRKGLQCPVVMFTLIHQIMAYLYLVYTILSFPLVMIFSVFVALFHVIVGSIGFLHYVMFDTPSQKGLDFGFVLTSITKLFFFVIETILKYILILLELSEYALKNPLCDVFHMICVCGLYSLYPVFYLLVIVWCVVKLVCLVFILLMYTLIVCLQFIFVAVCNLINLILFLVSVLLVLAVAVIVLACCIFVLTGIIYIWVYVISHLLLKRTFRIRSPLQYIKMLSNVNRFAPGVDDKTGECCVCFHYRVLVKFVCGHVNVCRNCVRQIRLTDSRCPLCRARI